MQESIKKRGISQEIYNNFGLTYKNKQLKIPVFDLIGKFLFYKIRHDSGKSKYTYSKPGSTAQLYCGHLIKDKDKVVLTEGELDALVLWSQGIPAVSTTSGAISNYKKDWVELLKDKEITICYDNDEAGLKGAAKLKKQFPNSTVLFLKDVKDVSEYYEKHKEVKSIFKLTKGKLPKIIETTYEPKNTTYDPDDRIQKAKDVPITQYQTFNKDNKIPCIFHSEKTPSLAYDQKTNTFKCFGCGEFGDSIAFYMKLFNVDFSETLNKMVGEKPKPTVKTNITKLNDELKDMGISPIDNSDIEEIEFLTTNSKNPQVRKIGINIEKILHNSKDFSGKFRYDSFEGKFETNLNDKWEPLEDHIIQSIVNKIQGEYPYFDSGVISVIKNQVILESMNNSISPPLEYIKSITWDKKPRLRSWIHKAFKVDDNEYYSEIGFRWIVWLVKRLNNPGCKFDHVLTVNGGQGFGKSTILQNLCKFNNKDYYNETTDTPDNSKEFAINLRGNIVVEFGEGAISGYSDQRKVKSFITKPSDNYRPPYMRNTEKQPRQCVFTMTTNDTEFLSDKTGERRYWIIDLTDKEKDIDFGDWDWVEENNEQLFAEAYHYKDIKWAPFTKEVQEYMDDLVMGHKTIDPTEDFIVNWYGDITKERKEEGIEINDIRPELINENPEFKDKYITRNISMILIQVLHLKKKKTKRNGKTPYLYFPTHRTLEDYGERKELVSDIIKDF